MSHLISLSSFKAAKVNQFFSPVSHSGGDDIMMLILIGGLAAMILFLTILMVMMFLSQRRLVKHIQNVQENVSTPDTETSEKPAANAAPVKTNTPQTTQALYKPAAEQIAEGKKTEDIAKECDISVDEAEMLKCLSDAVEGANEPKAEATQQDDELKLKEIRTQAKVNVAPVPEVDTVINEKAGKVEKVDNYVPEPSKPVESEDLALLQTMSQSKTSETSQKPASEKIQATTPEVPKPVPKTEIDKEELETLKSLLSEDPKSI